jgi:hypothetical protein
MLEQRGPPSPAAPLTLPFYIGRTAGEGDIRFPSHCLRFFPEPAAKNSFQDFNTFLLPCTLLLALSIDVCCSVIRADSLSRPRLLMAS